MESKGRSKRNLTWPGSQCLMDDRLAAESRQASSKLLARKFSNKPLRADDTPTVVSLTGRTERDLCTQISGVYID